VSEAAPDQQFTRGAGLQPERTSLAWQRTTLGLLLNAGLLLLREAGQPSNVVPKLALGVAAFVLAGLCAFLGWRRDQLLRRDRRPSDLVPTREVWVLGGAITAFAIACVVVLALPG
jgi:uncharacterized membrane protein YidH (DUF202 family)